MNIGKYQWAKQTSGILNTYEKISLFWQIIQSEWRLAIEKRRFRNVTLSQIEQIKIPDSSLIRNINADINNLYSIELLKHCIRTYCWASLLAHTDNVQVDSEQLYLASLLHDLGLSDQHIYHAQCGCFAVYGAEQAVKILQRHHAEEQLQHIVYEAISAHLNPWVDTMDFDNVAVYTNQGAFLDVTGKRLYKIHHANQNEVLQSYPRTDFQREILATMENPHHKSTRAGLMKKAFMNMVRSNPLDATINKP